MGQITETSRIEDKKISPIRFIILIIQGILVGGGAILPGISGGVLCMTFGIYRPLMATLAHPFKNIKKYYQIFVPFLIGSIIGFFLFAKVVEILLSASAAIATWLFIGMIAGTMPSLFKDAGKKGQSGKSWGCFTVGLIVVFALMSFLNTGTTMTIAPNPWWYFLSGIIWGLSLVVPGLSSSTFLIFLGLYQPMTEGITNFDLSVILPLVAGIGLTAIAMAKFVNYLFDNHYSIVFHSILGIALAATLVIVPTEYLSTFDFIMSAVCFVVGFIVTRFMDVYGEKFDK